MKLTTLSIIACTAALAATALAKSHREVKIADYFNENKNPKIEGGFFNGEKPREDTNVSEFGIEKTPCYGRCPVYTLIVQKDGTFTYNGIANVAKVGFRTGKVNPYCFNRVARLISESRYQDLSDAYTSNVTDSSATYTTAVINGRRKTIQNYADAGPSKLWAIEIAISGILEDARWDE